MTTSAPPAAPIDGRRARRERGRQAVVDAMLDLILERGAPPPVDDIAERAGVSVSSVFRYFDTLDDLQRQTTERFLERFDDLFAIPDIGLGERSDRIARFVRARVRLHRTVAPIARLSRARSLEEPHLSTTLGETRRRQADQVRRHFASELEPLPPTIADDVVASITTLTSFESWDQLSSDLARSDARIRRAWSDAVDRLLRP